MRGLANRKKPAVQAVGQTLPNATSPLGKIPLFTKSAVTFDPIKELDALRDLDYPKKSEHSLFYS